MHELQHGTFPFITAKVHVQVQQGCSYFTYLLTNPELNPHFHCFHGNVVIWSVNCQSGVSPAKGLHLSPCLQDISPSFPILSGVHMPLLKLGR